MSTRTLNEWLAWLERAHPSEIDLGLDRIAEVASRLNLASDAKVITVAGTNGKGSCVTAISALLMARGLQVGGYTSPHLQHYCERVRINGTAVSENDMCRAFKAVDTARGTVSLTYFEFGTLAALWLFSEYEVDVWVLEVGLGGRLDAVNIVDADVAVITSIAIDHEQWLGSDREAIGTEKAGIARAGKPLVVTDTDTPASIQAVARNLGAPLYQLGQDFSLQKYEQGWQYQDADLTLPLEDFSLPTPSVAAAIKAVSLLNALPEAGQISSTIGDIRLAGRMQRIDTMQRYFVLDVAHNPAAAELLATQLGEMKPPIKHCVFAIMEDKDLVGVLSAFDVSGYQWHLAELIDVPRALPAHKAAKAIEAKGGQVTTVGTMSDCIGRIMATPSSAEEGVVIFGSFFTVSAALAILAPETQ